MAANSSRNLDESEFFLTVEENVVKLNGEEAIRCYNKGRFLYQNGFAKCYEFINLENRKLAAAQIIPQEALKKSRAKQKVMSEIKIHSSLHHPNIVGFEHFFEDSENVYILLELCTNQTMSELLRRRMRLTEIEVQCYSLQIISALKYLHDHRVIHRDLKLGNLFLSNEMELKIGGFNSATQIEFEGERKKTICGTSNYIAPEILDSKEGHSYEVDIWSFGVIVYTLLVGKSPFEAPDIKTTYRRILTNTYSFPDNIHLSEASKDLIIKILVSDPAKRPSLDEILAHRFFYQGNAIPKFMPASTLACPPSESFLSQFTSPHHTYGVSIYSNKFADISPSLALKNNSEITSSQEFANTGRTPKIREETNFL